MNLARVLDVLVITSVLAGLGWLVVRANTGLGYRWNWSVIPTYLVRTDPQTGRLVSNLLLLGLLTTLRLAVWSLVFGTLLGTVAAAMLVSGRPAFRWTARLFGDLVRNTPPIVLIFVFYFFVSSRVTPMLGLDRALRLAPPWAQDLVAIFVATPNPLDAPGRHLGHLAVPFSDDAHAYGTIPVPIAVLSGAPGPTVLLAAGVYGDEYEGQIALRRLLTVDAASFTGRLIVLPALNLPAVRAARRTSPIDGANMNRAFPGSPDGGPTAQLADYVERVLLPRAQAAIDLHSGGSASEYLPCAYVYAGGAMATAKAAMADAFGAPLAIMVGEAAETRSLSTACERQNVSMIATELAGAGTLSRTALRLAWEGITAVLRHLGVMPTRADDANRHTRRVHIPDRTHVVMSPGGGLFEPFVDLGDTVALVTRPACSTISTTRRNHHTACLSARPGRRPPHPAPGALWRFPLRDGDPGDGTMSAPAPLPGLSGIGGPMAAIPSSSGPESIVSAPTRARSVRARQRSPPPQTPCRAARNIPKAKAAH